MAVFPGFYVPSDTPLSESALIQWLTMKQPAAVMNLISALAFHGMTTAIPYYLSVALPRGKYLPKMLVSPLKAWRMKEHLLEHGVEEHAGEYGTFRVTTPERTLVDCFRCRRAIGSDVFLEAAKQTLPRLNIGALTQEAERLHVLAALTPYLTAFLA